MYSRIRGLNYLRSMSFEYFRWFFQSTYYDNTFLFLLDSKSSIDTFGGLNCLPTSLMKRPVTFA